MNDKTILIVGSGGFIGGAIFNRLSDEGLPILGGVRRLPVDPNMVEHRRYVACDLDATEHLDAAFRGVGTIVHAAVGSCARMETQTMALLRAADRAGVRRIVAFSSVAVYGERQGSIGEQDAPVGRLDRYGAAKRRCEALLRRWSETSDGSRAATVLRPGIVYGRGSRFWIDDLSTRILAGGWGTFGRAGEGIAALIHVDDVVEAVRLALHAPAVERYSTFNLVGPDRPTWNAYFTGLAARIGYDKLRTVAPWELTARQAAALPAKLLDRCGVPMPTALARAPLPAEMRLFGRRAIHETGQAARDLGWTAQIGLTEGMTLSFPVPDLET